MTKFDKNLPKPTYWPMFFALGTTVMAWGMLTSWLVICVGGIVLIVSIVGWIGEVS